MCEVHGTVKEVHMALHTIHQGKLDLRSVQSIPVSVPGSQQ